MEINNINLNFLDNYYMFYDWLASDDIENFKKVAVFRVSSNILNDFMSYKIQILDETIFKNNNPAIFTDTYSYIAIEFDNKGYSTYKSSLLLEDELRINHKVDNLKPIKIFYNKIMPELSKNDLRINDEIRKTIRIELNTIIKENNIAKLEYLYYEWFKKKETDPKKMLSTMLKKIGSPLTKEEKYIYDLIKKSYRLV